MQAKERRCDRQIYVPPSLRKQGGEQGRSGQALNSKRIELIGRHGRIDDYEFEYLTKADAEHVYNALRKTGDILEDGLVRHVDAPGFRDEYTKKNLNARPKCVMQADLICMENCSASKSLEPKSHIDDVRESAASKLVPPRKQRECSVSQFGTQTKDKPGRGPSDNTSSSSNSPTSMGPGLMTPIKPLKNADRIEVTKDILELTVAKGIPSLLSRRLIRALWIRIYIHELRDLIIQKKDHSLAHILDQAEQYFTKILEALNFDKDTKSQADLHCESTVYVILGDIARYRLQAKSRQSVSKATDDGTVIGLKIHLNSDAWKTALKFYQRASALFPQDGHIYSQWNHLAAQIGDITTQVYLLLRSYASCFNCANQDSLTLLLNRALKPKCSLPNSNPSDDFFHAVFVMLRCIYFKVCLEDFERNLQQLNAGLSHFLSCPLNSATVEQCIKIMLIAYLLMVETSKLFACQSRLSQRLSDEVNTLPLVVQNESGRLYFAPHHDEHYLSMISSIHALYGRISTTYSSIFRCCFIEDLDALIESNEQFRASCIFLCHLTLRFIEQASSPVSISWHVISVGLTLLYHSNLFSVSSKAIKPLVFVMKCNLQKFMEKFHADLPFETMSPSIMGGKLPEDDNLIGFVPYPREFCRSEDSSKLDLTKLKETSPSMDCFCTSPIKTHIRRRNRLSKSLSPAPGNSSHNGKAARINGMSSREAIYINETGSFASESQAHLSNQQSSVSYPEQSLSQDSKLTRSYSASAAVGTSRNFENHFHATKSENQNEARNSIVRLARVCILARISPNEFDKSRFGEKNDEKIALCTNSSISGHNLQKGLIKLPESYSAPAAAYKKQSAMRESDCQINRMKKKSDKYLQRSQNKDIMVRGKFDIACGREGSILQIGRAEPLQNQKILIDGRSVGLWHRGFQSLTNVSKTIYDKTDLLEGNMIATQYYLSKKCRAVVILPDYIVEKNSSYGSKANTTVVLGNRTEATLHPMTSVEKNKKEVLVSHEEMVEKFENLKALATVPSQDFDWPYIAQAAYSLNACIVSNRSSHEMLDKLNDELRETMRSIKSRIISFTFVENNFLPNPDFEFPL